jgi:hypothetical protein
VYVDTSDGDGDIRLIAEGFLILPAVLGGGRTDIERATFAPSEVGVAQARAWLEALAAKHGF